jgi:hypothetical protein
MSPAQFETNQRLELYRGVLRYFTSYPSADADLELAWRLVQRLCPRINDLPRWTVAQVRQRRGSRCGRKPQQELNQSCTVQSRVKKRTSPRARLPTPPTQTGDVGLAETIPTLRATQPPKSRLGLLTPDSLPPSAKARHPPVWAGEGGVE